MRSLAGALAVCVLVLAAVNCADANVVVEVDKARQQMAVVVDGATRYVWPISTGRAGYGTPNGVYRPQRLERSWFSREYYSSPMPYSIFFHGGYAIHGSYEISKLGGPASHGCIRLHPDDAAQLFSLVQQEGPENTKIVVTGSNPVVARRAPYGAPVMEEDQDGGQAQWDPYGGGGAPAYRPWPGAWSPARPGAWPEPRFYDRPHPFYRDD